MLDLLRQLSKASFVVVLFFNLLYIASSLELGVSPSEVRINGNVSEMACTNFNVYSKGYEGSIIVDSKCSKSLIGEKDLKMYKYSASDVGLEVTDNDNLESLSEQTDEICFTASKPGKYRGVVIYQTEGKGAGVGSWIVLDIGEGFFDENLNRIFLIGAVIANLAGESSLMAQIMLFIFLFLTLILAILLNKAI